MTRRYAEVIGDPIAQSKSPLIHNFWLAKLGIDAEYRSRRVPALAAADYFTQVRADAEWLGCNVTMPLKGLVGGEIDRVDPLAARIGATNTVIRESDALVGYNSDGAGFLEPFEGRFDDDRRPSACLMGTGGAARSIAIALLEAEFSLTVLGRSRLRAADFALSIGAPLEIRPGAIGDPLGDPALLVNATSLGMAGQPDLPVSLDSLGPDAIVYDIVYSPLDTPLLAAARHRGLATIDGLQMLVGQAAVAFEKFFGVPAPRQHDAELRERLIA